MKFTLIIAAFAAITQAVKISQGPSSAQTAGHLLQVCDVNKDGKMSLRESIDCATAYGAGEEEIAAMKQAWGVNKDATLDQKQFTLVIQKLTGESSALIQVAAMIHNAPAPARHSGSPPSQNKSERVL